MKTLQYQLKNLNHLTKTLSQLFLTPINNEVLAFFAGQYCEIQFPDQQWYPFSIANNPKNTGDIELHVRHTMADSHTQEFIRRLASDSKINIRGPLGECILTNAKQAEQLIFIVGGTGFAQAKALIEQAIVEGEQRSMHLFRGVSNLKDSYLDDKIKQWQQQLPDLKYSIEHWKGDQCVLQEALIKYYQDLSKCYLFISGPPAMVSGIVAFASNYQLKQYCSD